MATSVFGLILSLFILIAVGIGFATTFILAFSYSISLISDVVRLSR